MRHNINLIRLVAAGGVVILPLLYAMEGQQSINSSQVILAAYQSTQLNIECESGTLEDPSYLIMLRKRQQAAEETLAELGVEDAQVAASDRGAVDCTIRARVETAVCRGREEE